MKKKIEISCERWNHGVGASTRFVLFRHSVDVDSSLVIPYEDIERSLRFLYGEETIVSFVLDSYFSNH